MKSLFLRACCALSVLLLVACSPDASVMKDDHDHHDHHHHEGVEVSHWQTVPSLMLKVNEDSHGGYNLQLITENFLFAPQNASDSHLVGEGHAHLYVDGEKVARVYSEWFHLGDLSSGEHVISASLNTNDHRSYLLDGEEILDEVTVVVP